MDNLKYRKRFTTSIDKGCFKAIYNYSIETGIPMSRLLDEALEDFFAKKGISYQSETPYKRELLK